MTVRSLGYELPGVGACWGLVDETTADRLSAPSDYLAAEATRGLSPNTICRRASTLAEYFQWAGDGSVDPLAPQSKDLNNYLSALQTTRKRHALSDPILTMPGDDRRRSPSTVAERVRDVKDFCGGPATVGTWRPRPPRWWATGGRPVPRKAACRACLRRNGWRWRRLGCHTVTGSWWNSSVVGYAKERRWDYWCRTGIRMRP